jgi:hypothetical protein
VVVVELQGQLFARQWEQDSREGALMVWENGLAASECAPEKVRTEHDIECDRAEAIQQDYGLGYTLLWLVAGTPSTLIKLWRNTESIFPYWRQT